MVVEVVVVVVVVAAAAVVVVTVGGLFILVLVLVLVLVLLLSPAGFPPPRSLQKLAVESPPPGFTVGVHSRLHGEPTERSIRTQK